MRLRIETDETLRNVLADELAKRKRPLNPDDPALYNPMQPRIAFPGTRPVRCD